MRVFCPNCQQATTVPDSEAGKTVECPSCQHKFEAPRMYAAAPIEAPPLPPAPPAPSPPAASATPTTPEPDAPTASPIMPLGYRHQASIPLNRDVCEWTVLISLLLIFLLTFFKWVGSYPAGYPAYTQNAWQALFADFSVDPVSEKVMGLEKGIDQRIRSSWWMLPYLLLLLVGLIIAWGNGVARMLHRPLPAVIQKYWHLRPAIVAGCAGLTLFFAVAQAVAGFGVPRALESNVEEQFKDEQQQAKTPEEIQQVEMKMGMKLGGYRLRTTTWFALAIALHIAAVLAIIGETLLIQRGPKSPPRVGVMW